MAAKKTSKANVSKDDLMHFYREMLLIRRFEEKAGQLYGMGLIGGFCHLYIGQEAVVVGLEAVAEEGDEIVFRLLTVGNMSDPNDLHISSHSLEFKGENTLTAHWGATKEQTPAVHQYSTSSASKLEAAGFVFG